MSPQRNTATPLSNAEKPLSRLNNREALALWHRVTMETVLSESPDLTSRQLAMMTTIYLEAGPHTVRSLAAKLNVTKAVITRAIDTLEGYHFLERGPDPRDKRSVIIRRTPRGSTYLTQFAEMIRAQSKISHITPVAA